MSTLYRKYRPQTFFEVAGQTHIKQVLQNEISSDKVAHAFLFSGPRGIGKTTIARILSKAINCENRKNQKSEPCNNCDACKEIIESKSLDVIEMDAATHTQVDKVRENIIENVRFTPTQRKYKIFIIDEVHMLSTSAFNALLKTLEEPPAHAIFILATTEIHKIPETIISRCQRFDFHKINLKDTILRIKMIASKEGMGLDEEIFDSIARNSDGGLRDAEGVLGQIFSLAQDSKKKITMDEASIVLPRSNLNLVKDFVSYLTKKDTSSALKFISKITEEGISIRRFMDETIEYLRQLLPAQNIAKIIEILLDKKQMAQFSKIDELPLELAVVEICGEGATPSIVPDSMASGIPPRSLPHTAVKRSDTRRLARCPQVKNKETEKQKNRETEKHGDINNQQSTPNQNKFGTGQANNNSGLDPVRSRPDYRTATSNGVGEIQKNWYDILSKAQEYNASLPVVLSTGVPLKIEDGILKIGFQYPLYKDRLNKEKNCEIVEKILHEVLKKKMCVGGVVVDNEEFEKAKGSLPVQPKVKKNDDLSVQADKVAESFGGKVVE